MQQHHVLIAGPPTARVFLENLAKALGRADAQVVCRGDLACPSDYEHWPATTVLVAFGIPCSDRDMSAAARLRAVVIPSLGFEGIDLAAAQRRGIAVANGRAAENFESVAEAAVLLILSALYRLREAQERLRQGQVRSGPPVARMLKGKTVGIIGHGNIGRALIRRLQGWEARILVCCRSPIETIVASEQQCDLETLLATSDIVVPLVPLTAQTRGLLAKPQLLALKRGAILVNLSRGAIIEEAALTDPEVAAHLGTIALDVFTTEPLPIESPLRAIADSILTNHEIAHTQENLQALFDLAVLNIRAALEGTPLPTALTGRGV